MLKDEIIKKLINILHKQIQWYHENKDDENLIYDEMIEQFRSLGRGDYVEIIALLIDKEKEMLKDNVKHPWAVYLEARANAIMWMAKEKYWTDTIILERLKMDETQVRMIREYMKKKENVER